MKWKLGYIGVYAKLQIALIVLANQHDMNTCNNEDEYKNCGEQCYELVAMTLEETNYFQTRVGSQRVGYRS